MSKFYRDRRSFFGSLFRNSGWYLVLAATATVIVALFALLFSSQPPESPKEGQTLAVDTGSVNSDREETNVSEKPTDAEVLAPVDPEPVRDVALIVPVQGTVGTGFSLTVPVFSETMKDWRVHQGIDYLTDEPAAVVAAADGTVEGVYASELMGLSVEIRHADGSITLYQSLDGEAEVEAGQTVTQGERIGMTGRSADCERLSGYHLHFAVLKNGVFQNPGDRFAS